MTPLDPKALAKYIDHTLLRPDATSRDIEKLCSEARQYGFCSVCVNGAHIEIARAHLEESDVKVAAVVGFPLGAMDSDVKRYETEAAIDAGAQEIDFVLNIGWLKEGRDSLLLREIRDIVEAADERPVKVIIETALLEQEQKMRACELIVEGGAQFVKTSTGFSNAGATVEDIKLLRATVGPKFGVKASGKIRDTATALAMIQACANRIGSSNSLAIIEGLKTLAAAT